ncbi:hypothetical protein Ancab_008285 [Ancistrocladus abbreviatus]
MEGMALQEDGVKKGGCWENEVFSRVFPEDYDESVKRLIVDPGGAAAQRWCRIFSAAIMLSLFIDPLFFFSPRVNSDLLCIENELSLDKSFTILRSLNDIFYWLHIIIQCRMAYVAPSSRVFGRGELVIDPWKIMLRYLNKSFWLDFLAALPLPQMAGACWYLFTVQRLEACWLSVCQQENHTCGYKYFHCSGANVPSRTAWLMLSNMTTICNPNNGNYQFGIYGLGVTTGASSSPFPYKYAYALWIGLQAICSTGQSLIASIYVSENIYCIAVGSVGLILMALLIAHMQRYLQSITARFEDWRLKRKDIEEWMHHRHLPSDLRHHVHKYDQLMWLSTRGVDEEALLNGFPADLQREIKRYLCLNLVRQVPFFDQLDELTLDAICERLRPALYTKDTFLVREGDPVKEIFFVIQGHLDSYTTDGGRNGFFNSSHIGQGAFCGEELLTWVLAPHLSRNSLPLSTRTIKAVSDVEAFCLVAEDLKFVSLQFRKLHSRELISKFRFYSLQWRTWAACYIQAAWQRFKMRKQLDRLNSIDRHTAAEDQVTDIFIPRPGAGIEVYAAELITNMRRANK